MDDIITRETITKAGNYLLKLLKEKGTIRYSEEIYDGTNETHEKLKQGIKLVGNWDLAPLLIDNATLELELMDIVTKTILDDEEKLADGDLDFTISLTKEGVEALEGSSEFVFRSDW